MKLILAFFFALLAMTVGYATCVTVHVVRQRRAERTLASQLAEDTTFRDLLAQYAEQIYQFGQPSPESVRHLWSHVLNCASRLRPHGNFVAAALTQPSIIDRHRYLGKVVEQALGTMLVIPVAELEFPAAEAAS